MFVAGGAVRTIITGESVSDIDIFFQTPELAHEFKKNLESKNAQKIFECPKGELFTFLYQNFKFQLIMKRYYQNATELLNSFDFTICRFGFELFDINNAGFMTRRFALNKSDMIDLQKRHLRIHRIEYPVATLNRVHKYMKKGFVPYHQEDFFKQLVFAIRAAPVDEANLALYID